MSETNKVMFIGAGPGAPRYLTLEGSEALARCRLVYAIDLQSAPFTASKLAEYDCVVISTNHDIFDCELPRSSARAIVDALGVFKSGGENIFPA